MSRMEEPVKKSTTTRKIVQKARVAGLTENKDLKESLIGQLSPPE